jgi:type I restriction enzyme S subunit
MEVKPGYKRTEVGVIPEEWEVLPFGKLAHIERGKFTARPRNDPKYYGGDIPFIQTGDVRNANGQVTTYSQTLNSEGLKVSKLFPRGTLFFTIAANIGDVGFAAFDAACPDSLVAITPTEKTDKTWLAYELAKRKTSFEKIATLNAQLNINLEKLRPYLLPVPPLPEQCAIAEVLIDVDGLLGGLDLLIAKKRDLKQAAMQQLLTGKTRLPGFAPPKSQFTKTPVGVFPEDWKLVQLSDLVDPARGIRYGIVQPGDYDPQGRYMIRGQDYSEVKGWAKPSEVFRVSAGGGAKPWADDTSCAPGYRHSEAAGNR